MPVQIAETQDDWSGKVYRVAGSRVTTSVITVYVHAIDQTCTITTRNIVSDLTLCSHRFRETDQGLAADLRRDHLTLWPL